MGVAAGCTKYGARIWFKPAIVFGTLLLVELFCYGRIWRQTGFYLDDWIMLFNLYFGPHDLTQAIGHYYFADARVAIRPVEAVHLALLYKLFGLKPLGYHALNGLMEILSAWFTYLFVRRLTGANAIALAAGILLLLYPSHDATHYWVVCSSLQLSWTCYIASLWLTLRGISDDCPLSRWMAVVLFTVSLFSYEAFLPLFLLNVFAVVVVKAKTNVGTKKVLKEAVLASIPFLAVIGFVTIYMKWFVPSLGLYTFHQVHFNPQLMMREILEGIRINLPSRAFPFWAQSAIEYFDRGVNHKDLLALAITLVVTVGSLIILQKSDQLEAKPSVRNGVLLVLFGIMAIVLSYLIFGLNPEYLPTLTTIFNRVNTGSAFGMSLLIVGLFIFLECLLSRWLQFGAKIVLSFFFGTVVIFFVMADWGLAQPWIVSWRVQSHIFDKVRQSKAAFTGASSILLINCPRYVMWSPVFDGVWDFQPMVRIALQNANVRSGVVSPRMVISKYSVDDVSKGFLCATYPFAKMCMIAPPDCKIIRVNSANDFVDIIERKGMTFDIDRVQINKWRANLAMLKGQP
jgi:hypothetical protein